MTLQEKSDFLEKVITELKNEALPDGVTMHISQARDHIVLRDQDEECSLCLWPLRDMEVKQMLPRLSAPVLGHKWTVAAFVARSRLILEEADSDAS